VKTTALKVLVVAGLIASLSACSNSSNNETDTTKDATPAVTIDETIKDQLTVDEGQAILPDSIESVTQENLSAECEAAVTPIRAIMAKGGALSLGVEDNDKATTLLQAAKEVCGAQEYADFYTKEFAGWFNAK
jgi:hypothetical protein